MLKSYLPAIIFVLLGVIVGGVFTVLNGIIGPKVRRSASQAEPYECGLPSHVQKDLRFGISFYMIAMLFILFDIETVLLYPVAIQLKAFGTFALAELLVFLGLLFFAFAYVWRKGALRWR